MKIPAPGEVDLWLAVPARCAHRAATYEALLDETELARMRAFRFPEHRLESVVTRALCRTVLSAYLGAAPSTWRFAKNPWGKPALSPPAGLSFNLTNHPSLVALAVTGGGEVGIDLEPSSRGDAVLEVAESVFSPHELRELEGLTDPAEKRRRAVDLWTLKESYIKARGMGLSLSLAEISMIFSDPSGVRLELGPAVGDRPDRWRFEQRDAHEHRISVCVEGAPDRPVEVHVRDVVPLDPLA